MGQQRPLDAVVAGAGVIGLSIAWRLARAGLAIAVCDERPGSGASGAAAGMLAPVTEAHYGEESLLELTIESARRWPEFAADLETDAGSPCGYRRCGTLVVARDSDDSAVLADLLLFQRSLGLKVERLRGAEARALEPALAPGTRAALLVEGDHQVDNRRLIEVLLTACRRGGVTFVPAAVTAIAASGEGANTVTLADGRRLVAAHVVVAAGCWSGSIAGLDPRAVPVRPVKGQLIHLKGEPGLFSRNVRGLEAYLLARGDGRYVVGATVEEMGFNDRPTAGAVHDLLRAGREMIPGISELEVTELAAGLRPGTPDNAPLIGRADQGGVVLATGHYRNGLLLAPVTADAITELIVAGSTPPEMAPFSPLRFGSREISGAVQ